MNEARDLFDKSLEYEAMLNAGLRYTGETKDYYLEGRLRDLAGALGASFRPARILDFGCGIGDGCARLAALYPEAEVVGVDTALEAVAYARRTRGSERVRFAAVSELAGYDHFDLCYANGVLHHVRPEDRPEALGSIRGALRRGGLFALFENNPWNPGTRFVMSRIPFDRGARPFDARAARGMLRSAGFRTVGPSRYLFYFPRALAFFRPIEPFLVRLPLGAQYWVLARNDAA